MSSPAPARATGQLVELFSTHLPDTSTRLQDVMALGTATAIAQAIYVPSTTHSHRICSVHALNPPTPALCSSLYIVGVVKASLLHVKILVGGYGDNENAPPCLKKSTLSVEATAAATPQGAMRFSNFIKSLHSEGLVAILALDEHQRFGILQPDTINTTDDDLDWYNAWLYVGHIDAVKEYLNSVASSGRPNKANLKAPIPRKKRREEPAAAASPAVLAPPAARSPSPPAAPPTPLPTPPPPTPPPPPPPADPEVRHENFVAALEQLEDCSSSNDDLNERLAQALPYWDADQIRSYAAHYLIALHDYDQNHPTNVPETTDSSDWTLHEGILLDNLLACHVSSPADLEDEIVLGKIRNAFPKRTKDEIQQRIQQIITTGTTT
jgi:hypothetical protein